jgi:hypothetical protein
MHIAIITCNAYKDAWPGFLEMQKRYWPTCPYETLIVADDPNAEEPEPWCHVVARHAKHTMEHRNHEDILVMQEDFFFTEPVRQDLILEGLYWFRYWNAGACRVYPSPGANGTWDHDRWGFVAKHTRYRINCQATIYRADYLYDIASNCGTTPSDFEVWGSEYSDKLGDMVLAFNYNAQPWPMNYLCSGITRGQWNPDTKRLFDANDISVDWSKRGFYQDA